MELKKYQRNVLDDLNRFLAELDSSDDISKAYESYWNSRGLSVGLGGVQGYRDNIAGVANVCMKVPTGGGKTFIATSALKPIFDSLPFTKSKAVVWLVPSDAILEQTLNALSNSDHPYRQRLDADFAHRVEVYSKQQLLNGQNFNPSSVVEQLSVCVLSYDSFRTKTKDGRKAYQENGNLALFAKFFADPSILLADTDDTALIQVIRYLNPVTIVDESHHATTPLSKEMLTNFNPSFILDLTATPKDDSNIIAYVDALQLKAENMVKLPVIVYNRKTHDDVMIDAIQIRDKLEGQARAERLESGRYIRPIVLFQAQPKNTKDSTTFDKLKQNLIDAGIPANQIAIKTADKNELSDINLLSEDCSIRYIITINALKEGWDCPFAYVLATIANRSSTVDVEQILGRILRLPYTKKNESSVLNISYVITSSNDFHETLDKVVIGLNNAGFSDKDYRIGVAVADEANPAEQQPLPPQTAQISFTDDDEPELDVARIAEAIAEQPTQSDAATSTAIDDLLAQADTQAASYELQAEKRLTAEEDIVPSELQDKISYYYINDVFKDEVRELLLPQFIIDSPASIFSSNETALLTPERLNEGFRLIEKSIEIDFSTVDAEIAQIDISGSADAAPKAQKLSSTDNEFFKKWFESKSPDRRIEACKDVIVAKIAKRNGVSDRDIREYVSRVIDNLSAGQLTDLQQSPLPYAAKIDRKIEVLLTDHRKGIFDLWIEQGKIRCEPNYKFAEPISPANVVTTLPRTLYTAEEDMNGLERDVAWQIANLDNIKWWHRNISRRGFAINGYVTAYPDIIAMTQRGKILMIEPKGDHLENAESRVKVAIGRQWQNSAGNQYRYYMVFKDKQLDIDGAVPFDRFIEIVKEL